jgi:hypothetical protein
VDTREILSRELRGSLDFFLDFTNLDPNSPGFGLVVDSTKRPTFASIAATGFALTAWVIAAARGVLPVPRAREIVRGTLRTLLENVSHHRGFFAHFLHIETAQRWEKCEYSTIDTALCLNGVLTAMAYFDDAAIHDLSAQVLARVDWNFIVFETPDGQARFHMAYNPDRDGDYVRGRPGFIGQWDMAAEQKMMYLQAAATLPPELVRRLYAGFRRDIVQFNGQDVIVNPGGVLFAYQFSEAWLDCAAWLDPDGIDWFENTRRATLANRQHCIDQAAAFATFHERSWGISAGDSPTGYEVSGAPPALVPSELSGTVSIYGAISSLPFAPEIVLPTIDYFYHQQPQTWGRYGFFDAYNLAVRPAWTSSALYGIDKGCSMIMIENYLGGSIWTTYTESAAIQDALRTLGFRRRDDVAQREKF